MTRSLVWSGQTFITMMQFLWYNVLATQSQEVSIFGNADANTLKIGLRQIFRYTGSSSSKHIYFFENVTKVVLVENNARFPFRIAKTFYKQPINDITILIFSSVSDNHLGNLLKIENILFMVQNSDFVGIFPPSVTKNSCPVAHCTNILVLLFFLDSSMHTFTFHHCVTTFQEVMGNNFHCKRLYSVQ